jgi:Domain of unknown function (DUF4743)
MPSTNVAILDKCDSHPSALRDPQAYSEAMSNYTFFQCNGVKLGYLLAPVVAALRAAKWEDWHVGAMTVEIAPENDTFEKRTAVMKATVDAWREEKKFKVLEGTNYPPLDVGANGVRMARRVV